MINTYAKIENGIVTNTILCEDSQISTLNGDYVKETESTNVPVFGFPYNLEKQKFESPQPYPSWTLNADTLIWESPDGPKPDGFYIWNEETLKWETLS